MSNTIVASVVQSCTASYSVNDTLDKIERLTTLARERDQSQLAVFPEAMIGGYPKFSTFGATIGVRSPEGREEFLRYHSAAIIVAKDSPAIQRLEEISRSTNVFLIIGVIEKDSLTSGTLYCTVVFVDPDAGLVAKHRKLVPTATERIIWGSGDGSTLPVIEGKFTSILGSKEATNGDSVNARMSAAICWENYMPLLRMYYYTHLTQIYCAPTVDAREVWQSTMTHIALEGRCFVLSACQFSQQKDYPLDHSGISSMAGEYLNAEGVMIDGGSVIIDPMGKVLAGPLRGSEGVLSAKLDLNDCIRGNMDLDVVGHYARPDVFGLNVQASSPNRSGL